MQSNTKKRGKSKNLENLKRYLVRGDINRAAKAVKCHRMTVYQALNGEPGPKREEAIDALITIVEERKAKQNKLKQL